MKPEFRLRPWAFEVAVCTLLLAVYTYAPAAALEVSVTGANGQPVADTVISIDSESNPPEQSRERVLVVDQDDRKFRPWVSAAVTGDRVIFRNSDEITHHVYSFSPVRRFSFRLQEGEERAAMTLDKAGTVVVGCNIHDWMVAYIRVTDAASARTTDESGTVRFEGLPPGNWRISLWHPGLDADDLPQPKTVDLDRGTEAGVTFQLTVPLSETGAREPPDEPNY